MEKYGSLRTLSVSQTWKLHMPSSASDEIKKEENRSIPCLLFMSENRKMEMRMQQEKRAAPSYPRSSGDYRHRGRFTTRNSDQHNESKMHKYEIKNNATVIFHVQRKVTNAETNLAYHRVSDHHPLPAILTDLFQ